jgi:hypothetical protein
MDDCSGPSGLTDLNKFRISTAVELLRCSTGSIANVADTGIEETSSMS